MSNSKPTNADRFVNAPFHVDGNCHDQNCPIPETKLPAVDLQAFEQAAHRILDEARSDVRTELYCGV